NRAILIHLSPRGDIGTRESPIGNPKLEYLPVHRQQIEAELHGMVVRWKAAGMPRDMKARHPFTEWAQVIGGSLMVNCFRDFLGNHAGRRTVEEPVRKALGLMGAFHPGEWLTATGWLPVVAHLGLVGALIPAADRESAESRARGLGVVLSAHDQETFVVEA